MLGIISAGLFSCKKESITTSPDAQINFSADTLFFDTVFTSIGSVTKSFKIVNLNDQRLKLSSVKLAGGASSPFKININGVPGSEVNDEIINANDSMYVFVQVNVNPTDDKMPFILKDSVEVQYNGKKLWMQLRAYGQNAIFLKNKTVSSDEVWNDSLPYVISGFLRVDSNVSLQINEGSRIYAHATAPLLVDGTLRVNGTFSRPVVFTGDRTDEEYKDLPSSWPGIYFSASSRDNVLKSVIIKNAYQGIISEQGADNGNPKVIISQSIIENIYDAGILALNSSLNVDNSLIANCGSNIMLLLGGKYNFVNNTVVTYGSLYINHKNPVLQAADYFEQSGTLFTSDMTAAFTNCIFWGDNGGVDNEILLAKRGNDLFKITFENCLYKAKDEIANADFKNSLMNTSPLFDSINVSRNMYNFHFNDHPESPAIGAGKPTGFTYDLEGNLRKDPPDIGCYER